MSRRMLGLIALMLFLVLPLTGLLAAVAFAAYPGETRPFTDSLGNAMALVFLYGALPGLLIVPIHLALLRRTGGTSPPTTVRSMLVGGALGLVMGAIVTQFVFWGLSVVLLGLFAGLVYGFLASRAGGRFAPATGTHQRI